MIVAVSRIPLPKTERYLCWVRVAELAVTLHCQLFIFLALHGLWHCE